ncbi:MAG: hypothetical protein JO296_01545 [Pseudonocardiales bacterium]|nr:hypothetical protein [Pseudonocardiales bacterium]MBV9648807.1 hypothetical protein [Pseudonocardiales bacterium]
MSTAAGASHAVSSAIDLAAQRLGHHAEQPPGAAVVAPIAALRTRAEQRQNGTDRQELYLETIDLRKAQYIRHAKPPHSGLEQAATAHQSIDGAAGPDPFHYHGAEEVL